MTQEPANIYESIDQMIDLCHRKIELMHELKRLLRIADLVGIPPKEMKELVTTTYRDTGGGSSYSPKPWVRMVFSVRVGDRPWEDFPLKDVHQDLWPAEMQRAHERWLRRTHPTRRGMAQTNC